MADADRPLTEDAPAVLAAALRKHVFRSPLVGECDLQLAASLARLRVLSKGAALVVPGEICTAAALVLRGCLRVSFTDADGVERVLSFAPEGWWVTDVESLLLARPSTLGIAAVEATELLLLDKALLTRLRTPGAPSHYVVESLVEHTLITLQRRVVGSMRKSAAQRYLEFRQIYPGLDRRIAQYHIAAYLGISPEFLSKLRKRLSERARNAMKRHDDG